MYKVNCTDDTTGEPCIKYKLKLTRDNLDYKQKSKFLEPAKKRFGIRVEQDIVNRINEIIDSADYKKQIDEYAQEIVEYVTEGWKNDLKESIKQRMCGDLINPGDVSGIPLRLWIQGIIEQSFRK